MPHRLLPSPSCQPWLQTEEVFPWGPESTLIGVKRTHSMRDVREMLLGMAYELARNPEAAHAVVVLVDSKLTALRLKKELAKLHAVIQPQFANKLHLVLTDSDGKIDSQHQLTPLVATTEFVAWIRKMVAQNDWSPSVSASQAVISAVVHLSLTYPHAISVGLIKQFSGASHPTVKEALNHLSSRNLVSLDNSIDGIRLKPLSPTAWIDFAKDDLASRKVHYYVDPLRMATATGLLKRVASLQRDHGPAEQVRVGGVIGARHHFPLVDITAPRRLDLSTAKSPDALAKLIDAGLQPVDATQADFAILAIHVTRDPGVITDLSDGIQYASHFECLADLIEQGYMHEAHEFASDMRALQGAIQ